jgi:NarL family two-component system response regulator LiaR
MTPTAEEKNGGGSSNGHEERRRREPIRVVVADRHYFFRRGLCRALEEYGLQVAGEAGTGAETVRLVSKLAPHVVIIDLDLLDMEGRDATRRVSAETPATRVLVSTMAEDDEAVIEAILAGACGFLLKDSPPADIASAVHAAFGGGALLSPRVGSMLLSRLREQEEERAVAIGAELSEREVEVLRLLATGRENQEIAAELHLSPSTIKLHISNILAKLHMKNRIQAAVYAARTGLL